MNSRLGLPLLIGSVVIARCGQHRVRHWARKGYVIDPSCKPSTLAVMRSPKALALERERETRSDVARTLYEALVAEYPDKSIIFYDDRGVMLAHTGDNREATARSLLSEQ